MPSLKTECTELSVAMGLLGVSDPCGLTPAQVDDYFSATLAAEKYEAYKRGFSGDERFYRQLYNVGVELRRRYRPLAATASLQWLGPQRQAATTSGAKDLLANNIPISVKAHSDLVLNASPYNLFQSLPKGLAPAQRSEHWFLELDPVGYQALYESIPAARTRLPLDRYWGGQTTAASESSPLPPQVETFERQASRTERELVQQALKRLTGDERREFERCYLALCHGVAEKSAALFNRNYADSQQDKNRHAVNEHLVRHLFRMDSMPYIVAGIDGGREFAVLMPDLTSWKREWKLTSLAAAPDATRRQSIVHLLATYSARSSTAMLQAPFHVEVRWSHGKFCGAPEAKLYKDMFWSDLAFVTVIV